MPAYVTVAIGSAHPPTSSARLRMNSLAKQKAPVAPMSGGRVGRRRQGYEACDRVTIGEPPHPAVRPRAIDEPVVADDVDERNLSTR